MGCAVFWSAAVDPCDPVLLSSCTVDYVYIVNVFLPQKTILLWNIQVRTILMYIKSQGTHIFIISVSFATVISSRLLSDDVRSAAQRDATRLLTFLL